MVALCAAGYRARVRPPDQSQRDRVGAPGRGYSVLGCLSIAAAYFMAPRRHLCSPGRRSRTSARPPHLWLVVCAQLPTLRGLARPQRLLRSPGHTGRLREPGTAMG